MKANWRYLFAVLAVVCFVQAAPADEFKLAPRLPNGLALNPGGTTFDVGNMPLAGVVSPEGKIVLSLSGFRQQGIQMIDPQTGTVIQTLEQPSAFVGLVFSADGKTLYASGGSEDVIYIYKWTTTGAVLSGKLNLTTPDEAAKAKKEEKIGVRYPAGIALSKGDRFMYVSENVSDTLAVVDLKTGMVVDRKPAGRYPYGVAVAPDGAIYVSAWGENIITRFRMDRSASKIRNSKTLSVPRHPSALLLSPNGFRLFVTSGSTDRIGIIDTRNFQYVGTLKDSVPGVQEGSTPNALAVSSDAKTLYVAEADSNAVAVFQLSRTFSGIASAPPKNRLLGRIPVGWYPTALLHANDRLYVVNGKGRGTRANPKASHGLAYVKTPTEYVLGQLNGTITELPGHMNQEELESHTSHVAELNNWNRKAENFSYPPFKHVLYVIKENRTYDQVFGDMPQGDGDPSLVFFPKSASPNHRMLAERFGLFDRFFVNAEVSSQGHPWSTSAYVTDFTEKTVHSNYSDRRLGEAPDDEVSDPAMGYIWDAATRGKVSLRIYGEYAEPSSDGKTYRATKKGAASFTSATYPSYDMTIQDQVRVDAWLPEFEEFVKKGEMPALQIFHLPNDHTAGAKAGMPTPRACFADNDLALGRMIERLSNSPFWKNTVVFVVEDDSQSGPDHVDSHRSILLVISPYNRPGVLHRFVNTTDVIATFEEILGLASLSQFDHYGRPLREIFSLEADLTPYKAVIPEQSLTEKNPEGKNATSSLKLKLEKEDLSDDDLFNRILWTAIKGDLPYPGDHRVPLLQLQQEE